MDDNARQRSNGEGNGDELGAGESSRADTQTTGSSTGQRIFATLLLILLAIGGAAALLANALSDSASGGQTDSVTVPVVIGVVLFFFALHRIWRDGDT